MERVIHLSSDPLSRKPPKQVLIWPENSAHSFVRPWPLHWASASESDVPPPGHFLGILPIAESRMARPSPPLAPGLAGRGMASLSPVVVKAGLTRSGGGEGRPIRIDLQAATPISSNALVHNSSVEWQANRSGSQRLWTERSGG